MNIKYRIIILTITFLLIFCVFLKVLNSNKTYQPNQMIGKKIPEFILENLFDKKIKIIKKALEKDKIIEIVNDVENRSNKDLLSAQEILETEFEKTKDCSTG